MRQPPSGYVVYFIQADGRVAVANVHYMIVEHEGGWAYKVGDVFSERYATHGEAREAAPPSRCCLAQPKTSSSKTRQASGTKKSLWERTDQRQMSPDEELLLAMWQLAHQGGSSSHKRQAASRTA